MGEWLSCPLGGFTCILFVFFTAALAGDTIRPGESLNDTETLVSAEGIFELGFYTAGASGGRFLGLWYHKVKPRVVVWVANRLRPVPEGSGVLRLSEDGVLAVSGNSSVVFWSSENYGSPRRPIARLLDDGNFVVVDDDSSTVNAGNYNWQSFDHPSDTLLPGMHIGGDRRTGLPLNITSSRSAGDPSPGNFTITIDPRGIPQFAIMDGSKIIWRGGPWIGERFIGIPEMMTNIYFIYGFVSNANDVSFRFEDWNRSSLSRLVVNESGRAQHYVLAESALGWDLLWESPFGFCDRMGACGKNAVCDSAGSPAICSCLDGFQRVDGGCVREKGPSDCRTPPGSFMKLSSVKWPDTSTATVNPNMGLKECKAACLRNCNCTAVAFSERSRCVSWFGDLLDIMVLTDGGKNLYVRGAVRRQGGRQRLTEAVTGTIVCLAVVIAFLVMLWRVLRRRAKRMNLLAMTKSLLDHVSDCERELDLTQFRLHGIVAATDNFSIQNKLGEGGFGPVFRGILSNGKMIAAKRLSINSGGQGFEEFKSEIKLLANLQHTNLVKLLGFCTSEEEKILVYEYMPNQSLDKFIFDRKNGAKLDWTKRANIIEGIAQGLLYLHRYSRVTAIHRDLKASNILLDGDWNPKISDFGLARIFAWNDAPWKTKRIVGTYGYIPPEYAMRGLCSSKSDVFSYGILVLEILSGRRNSSVFELDESLNISGYAWKLWRTGNDLQLMDPMLKGTCVTSEFSRRVHVALLCIQENAADRPTMLDIVSMLNNESVPLPSPNWPAYFLERMVMWEDGKWVKRTLNSSSNDITYSEVQGR